MTSRAAFTTLATVAALAGGTTAVALASGGGRDHPEDDGTTTAETTTTGTTTTDDPTATPTPAPTAARRAPRIVEIEADDAPGDRIRLEAEVKARGSAVTGVRFTYRGETYTARRSSRKRSTWARTVPADSTDLRDDAQITIRVQACSGDRCTTRTGRDDA